MTLARSLGRLGVLAALVALCALVPPGGGAASLPNHRNVEALFVIDHDGKLRPTEHDLPTH